MKLEIDQEEGLFLGMIYSFFGFDIEFLIIRMRVYSRKLRTREFRFSLFYVMQNPNKAGVTELSFKLRGNAHFFFEMNFSSQSKSNLPCRESNPDLLGESQVS